MALIEIDRNPSSSMLRQFAGIWWPAFWSLVALVVWRKTGSPLGALGLFGLALFVSAVGLVQPGRVRPIYVGWMMAAFPIGWLISHVLLGVVYFGLITPLGFLRRTLAGDPMTRKFDREARSYWVPHNPHGDTKRYFRQF